MNEVCGDNRFEIIAEYKKRLIEGTNIESSPEEMAVIDSILFRLWQMRWLPPLRSRPSNTYRPADAPNPKPPMPTQGTTVQKRKDREKRDD